MRKVQPPAYLLAAIAAMVALHFGLPLRRLLHFPWAALGAVPLAAGLALNLVADGAFKAAGTTVKSFHTSSALVTGSVFRISRNPMYLGMVLTLAGAAFLLGTLSPWLVVPPVAVVFDVAFIRPEEATLHETFGEAFREYRKHVRRWL